jgi:hypothetical protein
MKMVRSHGKSGASGRPTKTLGGVSVFVFFVSQLSSFQGKPYVDGIYMVFAICPHAFDGTVGCYGWVVGGPPLVNIPGRPL